jgi:predicted TIM-barrel fold metal-dependent hydrolase
MRARLLLPLIPLVAACATTPPGTPAGTPPAPRVDYHQHLVSAAFEPIVRLPARDGRALIAQLDSAGIGKAVVLSVGYSFADERKKLEDPDRLTRVENDWTSAQVAAGGGRLMGFCGVNPLRPAALDELERCLALPGMVGIKQHFGNAGVSLRDPVHAARMAQVFALAERLRAPVLVHMRARGGSSFGADDARLFLDKLVAVAPSIEIVVAHLGGAGPGYPQQADEVMAVFGAAVERQNPRMRNVYFDVATAVTAESTPADAALVARRIRQVGTQRVLYGSDLTPPGGSIRAGWEIFRTRTPLTDSEIRTIAGNVTRFAR